MGQCQSAGDKNNEVEKEKKKKLQQQESNKKNWKKEQQESLSSCVPLLIAAVVTLWGTQFRREERGCSMISFCSASDKMEKQKSSHSEWVSAFAVSQLLSFCQES